MKAHWLDYMAAQWRYTAASQPEINSHSLSMGPR